MYELKPVKGAGLPRCAMLLALAALVGGCASNRHDVTRGPFTASAPFSKTISGSGDSVCWSVKRALLSQGYMLERSGEPGVLTGTRDYQPSAKLNVTLRLQTTCADNRNGTSIVFVTAEREESQLQKMKQSTSVGIGPATLTMPSGSARVLGVVRRETIQDPNFYNSFFALVEQYVVQDEQSHVERHAELRKQGNQSNQSDPGRDQGDPQNQGDPGR
jgi:Uncharacterized protein conserved in bacteria (DUF2242)